MMWKRVIWISAAGLVMAVVVLATAGWLLVRRHHTLAKVADVTGPDGSVSHELWHARNGNLELRRRDGSLVGSINDYYSDFAIVRTSWRADGSVELITAGKMSIEFQADGSGRYGYSDPQ
jgi:hypothetical protein